MRKSLATAAETAFNARSEVFTMLVSLLALLPLLAPAQDAASTDEPVEVRAAWISADDDVMTSQAKIAETMDWLHDHGFNVVLATAWSRGLSTWPSHALEVAKATSIDPRFGARDPWRELTMEAHRAGIEIIAVFEGGMACADKGPGRSLADKLPEMFERDASKKPLAKNGRIAFDASSSAASDFVIGLASELVREHEIDGVAFEDGFPSIDPAKASDAKKVEAIVAQMEKARAELKKIDPTMITAFIERDCGPALLAAAANGAHELVIARVEADGLEAWKKKLDAVATADWAAKNRTRVVPRIVLERAGKPLAADEVLAAMTYARSKELKGEVLAPFAALRAEKEALGEAIEQKPYYAFATLPWRHGATWRPPAKPVAPVAGEGTWTWRTDASGIAVLETPGGSPGDAAWSLRTDEKGNYELWVWMPSDVPHGDRAVYSVAMPEGVRSAVTNPSRPAHQGWVALGGVKMKMKEERSVLKLKAGEADPAKVVSAGPMIALIRRRP
jgi:hypothetical protein